MIATNRFIGINQDLAKTKFPNTQALEIWNMRPMTDTGLSSGSIQNVKGNTLDYTIPNTRNVYELFIDLVGPYAAGTITINGQTSAGTFTPSATASGQDLYDFISNDPNLTSFGGSYDVAVGSNYVIIYATAITANPSFTGTGITISIKVPAETNLIPIGFCTVREEVYLFTTPSVAKNPGGHDISLSVDASSTGQIFKLTYDEINQSTSIKLIYNNYIDFTTYHPIPTTAALGRYENSQIKRIYWTDFFNTLRSVNVADPNLMAINPEYLGVNPPVKYSIPRLNEIKSGGVLDVGCYQAAYMLRNTGGAITNYSELSNLVFIVEESETTSTGGANFKKYVGNNAGTVTNKTIEWLFEDLDTNFDIIDIIVIKRDSLTGNVEVMKVAEEPIPSDGSLLFTYTGTEDISQIEFDDFISIKNTFTHCKTIEQKDNRLFAANIRNQYSDINYDARAFRAKTSGADDIYLTNNGVQTLHTSAQAQARGETEDTINDYTSVNAGFYKPNTAILGGSGANISYEFGTVAVKADSTIDLAATSGGSDYRHTNPDYSISDYIDMNVKRIDSANEQIYPLNTINDDIKYSYISSIFKGYERNEIYRFGIVFYDKRKNPTFVKWIGDIKMPNFGDTNPNNFYENGTNTPNADFRLSFVAGSEAYVNQLFVKFEVKIPDSLTNIVSGYSIVRVKREQEDKTILATGLLTQTESDGGKLWLPDFQTHEDSCPALFSGHSTLNLDGIGNTGVAGTPFNSKILFDSPEFLLSEYQGYKSGDQLKVVCRNTISNIVSNTYLDTSGPGVDPYTMYKYYGTDAYFNTLFNINEAGVCNEASNFAFSGWSFNNCTRTVNDGGTIKSDAIGSKTLCVGLTTELQFDPVFGCTDANDKKLIAQYLRTVSSQYGGNTYSVRSRNEYILCSHFRPIQEYRTLPPFVTTDTFKVFGGDIYCQIYDNQKEIKNWGPSLQGHDRAEYTSGLDCTPGANRSKVSITFFFPTLSALNTGLRHGNYINRNLETDDGSGASGFESHDYNPVYSCENDLRKFYPKPIEFVVNDEFDNRVYYSEIKFNGETSDSWGMFLSNNFNDVDGIYGPINGLELLNDNMIFLQEKAVGYLLINPVSQIQDVTGTAVVLGKGDVIQKYDYINNHIGTRHQNSIIKSAKGIYFIDSHNRRAYRISGEGIGSISEIEGMSSWFNKHIKGDIILSDNPIFIGSNISRSGICGGVFNRFNEVIYTIHDDYTYVVNGNDINVKRSNTICFNEILDKFTSFYSFTPYLYIYDTRFMSTFDPSKYNVQVPVLQQQCFIHNSKAEYGKFYNTYETSSVKFVVNQNPSQHKIFDNLHLQTEVLTAIDETETDTGYGSAAVHETFNKLRVYNDYQDTGNTTLTVNSNITRRNRYWKTYIPNDTTNSTYSSFKPRMRDFYAFIDLGFTNNNNKRFICHDILTEFRLAGSPISSNG